MSTSRKTASALVIVGWMLIAGCGGSPDDLPREGAGPAAADTVINPAAEAVSRAQRLDEGLPFAAGSVRHVEMPDGETHTVRLWRRGGHTLKLMASAPDEAGRRPAHTEYYFENSQLFLIHDPDGRYVFADGQLTLVLDDLLNPVTIPDDLRAEHEVRLQRRLDHYLAAYDD